MDTKKKLPLIFLCLFLRHRSVKNPFWSKGYFADNQSCKIIAIFCPLYVSELSEALSRK
jgi:hypothetical protein